MTTLNINLKINFQNNLLSHATTFVKEVSGSVIVRFKTATLSQLLMLNVLYSKLSHLRLLFLLLFSAHKTINKVYMKPIALFESLLVPSVDAPTPTVTHCRK